MKLPNQEKPILINSLYASDADLLSQLSLGDWKRVCQCGVERNQLFQKMISLHNATEEINGLWRDISNSLHCFNIQSQDAFYAIIGLQKLFLLMKSTTTGSLGFTSAYEDWEWVPFCQEDTKAYSATGMLFQKWCVNGRPPNPNTKKSEEDGDDDEDDGEKALNVVTNDLCSVSPKKRRTTTTKLPAFFIPDDASAPSPSSTPQASTTPKSSNVTRPFFVAFEPSSEAKSQPLTASTMLQLHIYRSRFTRRTVDNDANLCTQIQMNVSTHRFTTMLSRRMFANAMANEKTGDLAFLHHTSRERKRATTPKTEPTSKCTKRRIDGSYSNKPLIMVINVDREFDCASMSAYRAVLMSKVLERNVTLSEASIDKPNAPHLHEPTKTTRDVDARGRPFIYINRSDFLPPDVCITSKDMYDKIEFCAETGDPTETPTNEEEEEVKLCCGHAAGLCQRGTCMNALADFANDKQIISMTPVRLDNDGDGTRTIMAPVLHLYRLKNSSLLQVTEDHAGKITNARNLSHHE